MEQAMNQTMHLFNNKRSPTAGNESILNRTIKYQRDSFPFNTIPFHSTPFHSFLSFSILLQSSYLYSLGRKRSSAGIRRHYSR